MHQQNRLLWLLGLCLLNTASADTLLEYLVAESGAKSARIQAIIIKDGKILAKSAGGDKNLDFIYSSAPEQLSIIDHHKHTVMILDQSQVDRIAKQTETVQPLLQGLGEQIGRLNAKQRSKWEEILGGKISLEKIAQAAKPVQKANILKTGQQLTVAGFSCEQMNVFQGGTKTAEICLANPVRLKLSNEDYATIRSLLGFSERLAKKTQGLASHFGISVPNLDLNDLAGLPLELRTISKNSENTVKLKGIVRSAVPVELMEIPRDYHTEQFKLWK